MEKIAVLFADGLEESEGLTIVDILRRAQLSATIVGVTGPAVTGAHGIEIQADLPLHDAMSEAWDMVVIPGGYQGVENLLESPEVIELVRRADAQGKWIGAICAGPLVLDRAGALNGKSFTCYPGLEGKMASGKYMEAPVVTDGNCITGAGPALSYAFAYALVDAMNGDSAAVKRRMVYPNAFDESRPVKDACPVKGDAVPAPARVAVLMKEGYEEGETFSIVDILRRLGIPCDTFGFTDDLWVRGMHQMTIKADKRFPADIENYDVVVLPGGRPGGQNLKEDPAVIDLLRRWNATPGKLLSALCSGTTVLAAAEVIQGKRMTGYTGYAEKLPGTVYEEKLTVADQNLVTSQGPATGYPFAFRLAETLGHDTTEARRRLLYGYAGGKDE